METISVIMPVYNVEEYVEASIRSVCRQTYSQLELVIVNDGSTDGTLAVCERMAAEDSRIRIITTENQGPGAARNAGIEIARGEWFAFLDSDDMLSDNCLELLYSGITKGVLISAGAFTRQEKSLSHAETASFRVMSGHDALLASLYQHDISLINTSQGGKLYHRSVFSNILCTPGILYEDLEVVYRVLLNTDKIAITRERVYFYRQRPGSILNSFNAKRLHVVTVCEEICKYPGISDNPELLRAAEDRLFSASYNMLLLMHRHHYVDKEMISRCRNHIRRFRRQAIFNPRVRLKNKLGAIASYLFLFHND